MPNLKKLVFRHNRKTSNANNYDRFKELFIKPRNAAPIFFPEIVGVDLDLCYHPSFVLGLEGPDGVNVGVDFEHLR